MQIGLPKPDEACPFKSFRFRDRLSVLGRGVSAAPIEIVATLLTVKLLSRMSVLEQAVQKVD